MSENARQIVDGRGVQRVIASMQQTRAHRLRLRAATLEDCRLLWEWRNDPEVRANSFNPDLIRWDEHVDWFRQKLADPNCLIYVVVDEESTPIGQVRFDINYEGSAEVDVSIDVKARNKGYGSAALKLACQCAVQEFSVRKALAHIKEDNKASISAFAKAGFINKGLQDFKGHKAIEMVWAQGEIP